LIIVAPDQYILSVFNQDKIRDDIFTQDVHGKVIRFTKVSSRQEILNANLGKFDIKKSTQTIIYL